MHARSTSWRSSSPPRRARPPPRSRALRAVPGRLAVPGPRAGRLRRGRRPALRRRRPRARARHRAPAPGRRPGTRPRAPGRAPRRPDRRRRHPRHGPAPGRRRARRRGRRSARRGLRGGKPGRRRLPPGQRLLARPAGRVGRGPGRGSARRPAQRAVLERRGAGPQRRALRVGLRSPRGGGLAPGRSRGSGGVAGLGLRGAAGGGAADRRLPRRRPRLPRRCAVAADAGGGALLRRVRRNAARPPRAVRGPRQPRPGARAAQAVLPDVRLRAPGGGDRRGRPALPGAAARVPPGGDLLVPLRAHVDRAPHPGRAPGADVPGALALERDARPGHPPHLQGAAPASGARAHAGRRPARRGLPRPDGVPRQRARRAHRRAGSPAGPGRPCATAWARPWTPSVCRRWSGRSSAGT